MTHPTAPRLALLPLFLALPLAACATPGEADAFLAAQSGAAEAFCGCAWAVESTPTECLDLLDDLLLPTSRPSAQDCLVAQWEIDGSADEALACAAEAARHLRACVGARAVCEPERVVSCQDAYVVELTRCPSLPEPFLGRTVRCDYRARVAPAPFAAWHAERDAYARRPCAWAYRERGFASPSACYTRFDAHAACVAALVAPNERAVAEVLACEAANFAYLNSCYQQLDLSDEEAEPICRSLRVDPCPEMPSVLAEAISGC